MRVDTPVAIGLCCWALVLLCLTISIGSIAVDRFSGYDAYRETGTDKLTQLYDLGRDWQQKTFTDIKIVNDDNCDFGWEPVYSRIFGGAETGCNCLGISNRWIDTDNEFNVGEVCSHNETRAGCATPSTFPTYRMSQFDGKRICGQAQGDSYLDATLPTGKKDSNQTCSEGYLPCLTSEDPASLEDLHTFCYKEGDDPK